MAAHRLICETRDIFQARLGRFYRDILSQIGGESEAALLAAIAGEIGNNCFDHNLGQWRDVPGCWFDYGSEAVTAWMAIADRGQGVLSSLKRADPSLQSDQGAVDAAFHRRLSGRSPERRGNGLKFVRGIVNGDNNRGLFFISGQGQMRFGGLSSQAQQLTFPFSDGTGVMGTLAVVLWSQGL